jgi:hypothetical protein
MPHPMPELSLSADAFLVHDGGETHFPCAGTIQEMSTSRLLELMEEYESMAAEDLRNAQPACAAIRRIADGLAHRLGIHCPAYIALMCDSSTARDWRNLFPAC